MDRARAALEQDTANIAGFYQRVAALVGRPAPHQVAPPVSVPALVGLNGRSGTTDTSGNANRAELVRIVNAPNPHLLWVEEALRHLTAHAQAITGPASDLAEQRRLPWWR
jgi:hypothetical protein